MYSTPQSDYEKVRDFTVQAGQHVTDVPTALSKDEVRFLLRMCLSELQELALSVTDSVEQSVAMLHSCMDDIDKSAHEKLNTEDEIIAAQADAVVDAWYYSCNAFAKKSVDISQVFGVVHDANMAKRDPKTKKFIKREDGKIIKPEGWKAPDIVAEIARQRKILTDAKRIRSYRETYDLDIPNDREYDTVKRCALSVIEKIVRSGVEGPSMMINVDEEKKKATVTFVWEDRLKLFVYSSGNTSVLDLTKEELLDNGFSVDSAVKCVLEWLKNYREPKPTLSEAQQLHDSIKLEDMK